jgi:hypothetical protein
MAYYVFVYAMAIEKFVDFVFGVHACIQFVLVIGGDLQQI